MATDAAPSAAKVATHDHDASVAENKQASVKPEKPEKPDEAAFKEGLARLDNSHLIAQQKFVSHSHSRVSHHATLLLCSRN
jgi:hypothetical protein